MDDEHGNAEDKGRRVDQEENNIELLLVPRLFFVIRDVREDIREFHFSIIWHEVSCVKAGCFTPELTRGAGPIS